MNRFIVAPEAEEDVFQIWRYLVERTGTAVADRIEREILDQFTQLAQLPGKGHRRPDLTDADVRFFTVYEYLIVYRIRQSLEIMAVLHAKPDVARLLGERL